MFEADNKKRLWAGYLQFDVKNGDIAANLSKVEEGLADVAASNRNISPGIIVLPELWATGFAYDRLPALTGEIPALLKSLRNLAAKYRVHIAGSLPEHSEASYYNTIFIINSEGVAGSYRKQRLFNPMQENLFFTPGAESEPIQTELGLIGSLVCYDLRFPELLRAQAGLGADIAIISAQWPTDRTGHWRILLQARAIENQMFVLGANRCGSTGDTSFGGHSMIIAPDGTILLEAGAEEEFRATTLKPDMISSARSLFRTIPESSAEG